jgi:hypothetical protein
MTFPEDDLPSVESDIIGTSSGCVLRRRARTFINQGQRITKLFTVYILPATPYLPL